MAERKEFDKVQRKDLPWIAGALGMTPAAGAVHLKVNKPLDLTKHVGVDGKPLSHGDIPESGNLEDLLKRFKEDKTFGRKSYLDTKEGEKIKRFLRSKGITARTDPSIPHFNGYFHPDMREVVVGERGTRELLLHELGHATGNKFALKKFQPFAIRTGMIGRNLGPSAGVLGYMLGHKRGANKKETLDNVRHGEAVAGAGAAMMVPLLGEEARASVRAAGFAKRFAKPGEGNRAAIKTLAKLAPAYGTYAGVAAIPAVAAGLLHRRKKQLMEKKSAVTMHAFLCELDRIYQHGSGEMQKEAAAIKLLFDAAEDIGRMAWQGKNKKETRPAAQGNTEQLIKQTWQPGGDV